MTIPAFINIGLVEWLVITGKATGNNKSFHVPANGIIRDILRADNDMPYVLLYAVQFDGVMSGQIAFEFTSGRVTVGGYAVQAFIQPELILSQRQGFIRYAIQSTQSFDAVCNLDFLSIEQAVVDNDLMPALNRINMGMFSHAQINGRAH